MRNFFIWLAGLAGIVIVGFLAARTVAPCSLPPGLPGVAAACTQKTAAKVAPEPPPPPLVSVVTAREQVFHQRLFVSGTLVARDEALVGPQIDGLRILEVLAEDGDRVEAGQVLVRLDRAQLDALLDQNDAARLRAAAAIQQAQSQLSQMEANLNQANQDLDRAQKMAAGVVSQATLEQKTTAFRMAQAQEHAARAALAAAEADKAAREAERRELQVRIGRTEVKAPVAGIISRRMAKVGAVASGQGESLFRIITDGAVELDAEAPADAMAKLRPGMPAEITAPGRTGALAGTVRLVSEEVDKTTRTGKVRIALQRNDAVRIGSFATGVVETEERKGLAVPSASLQMFSEGIGLQVVRDGHIERRQVKVGLTDSGMSEIVEGLKAGELVVAKSAAFLRAGDLVRTREDGTGVQGGTSP